MRIYNRYIIYNLMMPVLVIALTLTGIVWLTQSLRLVDLIVNKGLDVATFLYISSLLIPSLLMIVLPIALFCSSLYIYNKLICDSELIVFKSAGLSKINLAKPAFIVSAVITLIGYILSLYILPTSYREFKDTQVFVRNNYASLLLQERVFSTPTKGLTVYIESRGDEGMLEGILVYDSRDIAHPKTIIGQKGRLVKTTAGPVVEMIRGNIQQIDKENGNLDVLYFDNYQLNLSVYTSVGGKRWHEPEERYINELFFPDDADDTNRGKLIAEGHHRIIWPLYSFVLMLVALAALFSGQFSRRGQWKRILFATCMAVFLVVIDLALKNAVAKNTSLAILMYLNVAISIAASLYILVKNKIINNWNFLTKRRIFKMRKKLEAS